MPQTALPRMLDMEQAAEYVGAKFRTFQQLYRKWQVPHFKVGRAVVFRQADLDAWLTSRRQA